MNHTVKDCFQITLPEDREVHYPIVQITLMSHSPDRKFQVRADVRQSPIPQKDNEYIRRLQKHAVRSKDVPHALEESGSLHIDNQEAQWSLFSFHDTFHEDTDIPSKTKKYWLLYHVQTSEKTYSINFHGDYDNLETDRKTIDEIISNFKILK